MRLIDISGYVLKGAEINWMEQSDYSITVHREPLYKIPTVDAAPVVHARWVEPVPGDGFPYCGNCKAPALNKGLFLNPKLMDWYKTKYCPNCGAKMDLEEQDESN